MFLMSKSKVFSGLILVVFELFDNVVLKTAYNFIHLCTHSKGFEYKNSCFHRRINGFIAQKGEITKQNGTEGK